MTSTAKTSADTSNSEQLDCIRDIIAHRLSHTLLGAVMVVNPDCGDQGWDWSELLGKNHDPQLIDLPAKHLASMATDHQLEDTIAVPQKALVLRRAEDQEAKLRR